MKPFVTALFCASLLVNAVLVYRRIAAPTTEKPPAPVKASAPPKRALNWAEELSVGWQRSLRIGDPEVAVRLRAAGMPLEVVRELLKAQVQAQAKAKENDLTQGREPPHFWHRDFQSASSGLSPSESLDLQRESETLLQKMLGDDYVRRDYSKNPLNFFPPEILDRLDEINEDYDALASSVHPSSSALILPPEREKLAFLAKEKRTELEKILTPDQLLEYDLRRSRTASALRDELLAFEPTEEEFRELFKIRHDVEQQDGLNDFDSSSPGVFSDVARENRWKSLQAKYAERLGPERFAEYQRAQTADFKTLHGLADHLQLPLASVTEANSLTTSFKDRLRKLSSDDGHSAADEKSLEDLSKEAEVQYSAVLGHEGFEAYKPYGSFFTALEASRERLRTQKGKEAAPAKP